MMPKAFYNRALGPCLMLALLGALCLNAQSALAGPTPAGTIIRNQGMVSYESLAGAAFEASSNEIIMIVQPVFGISIIPDGSPAAPGQIQHGVAGLEMIFPYILTFTGNIADSAFITPVFDLASSTFVPQTQSGPSGFFVYNDLDQNGVVDPTDILVASWVDANNNNEIDPGEIQSLGLGGSYGPDESASLLVVIRVPAGTAAGSLAHFGIDGVSAGDATKTDTGNVSRAQIIDDAVMTVVKSANPPSKALAGSLVAYSVDAANVGTNNAVRRAYTVDVAGVPTVFNGVLLYDVLPLDQDTGLPLSLGLPAPAGSDTASNQGTIIYSDRFPATGDPATWDWFIAPPANTTAVGYITSNGGAVHYDIPVAGSITLSLAVTAPASRQIFSNQAHCAYLDNSAAYQRAFSNIVSTIVTLPSVFGVDIRDTDYLIPPPPKTSPDDGGGVSNDTQTQANALAGTWVYFTNRVQNTGQTEDSFNISLAGVPGTWSAVLLKADGISPLNDTGFDAIPDTGVLAPGAFADIVVRVAIPADSPDSAVPVSIVVTATSVNEPAQTDTTTNTISSVSAASMNLANTDAVQSIIEVPVSRTTNAGSFAEFPLIVQNTAALGGAFDTYILETPGLPAGWSVVFYLDANQNALVDDAELIPMLQTPPIAAGGYATLVARVFAPADANFDAVPGGAQDPYDIIFRATSTNNGNDDSITNQVWINPQDVFELFPSRSGTIEPGGVATYTHTIVNKGSRPNRFYLVLEPGTPTFSYMLYDENITVLLPVENVAGNDLAFIDLTEAGGALDTQSFTLRIFAPANTPVGIVDVTAITAQARDFAIALTPRVVDTTITVTGALALLKSSLPAEGFPVLPGDNISYTTQFFNKGVLPVNNFILLDQIPLYTSYILQSGSSVVPAGLLGAVFQVSRDGGISWADDNAGAGPDSTVTNVRVVFAGELAPGLTGSASFSVEVQ